MTESGSKITTLKISFWTSLGLPFPFSILPLPVCQELPGDLPRPLNWLTGHLPASSSCSVWTQWAPSHLPRLSGQQWCSESLGRSALGHQCTTHLGKQQDFPQWACCCSGWVCLRRACTHWVPWTGTSFSQVTSRVSNRSGKGYQSLSHLGYEPPTSTKRPEQHWNVSGTKLSSHRSQWKSKIFKRLLWIFGKGKERINRCDRKLKIPPRTEAIKPAGEWAY